MTRRTAFRSSVIDAFRTLLGFWIFGHVARTSSRIQRCFIRFDKPSSFHKRRSDRFFFFFLLSNGWKGLKLKIKKKTLKPSIGAPSGEKKNKAQSDRRR